MRPSPAPRRPARTSGVYSRHPSREERPMRRRTSLWYSLLLAALATAPLGAQGTAAAPPPTKPPAPAPAPAQPAQPRETREQWQRVPDIFTALRVAPGSRVADVGAGDGYLTERLARHVGPGGRVFAVDVSEGALGQLQRLVEGEKL